MSVEGLPSKVRWRRVLSNVVLLGSFLLLIWYIRIYGDKFQVLKSLEIGHILILILIGLVAYAVNSLLVKVFAAEYGYKVPYFDAVCLFAASSYWNYLPARMGTFVRAAYLKTHYKFPFYLYAVYMTAPQVLFFKVYGVLGLIVCLFFQAGGVLIPWSLILFLALVFILSSILSRLSTAKHFKRVAEVESLQSAMKGWEEFWRSVPLQLKLTAIQLALTLIQIGRMSLVFYLLFGDPYFFYSIFITIMNSVVGVVSITPGNLGVREGIVAISAFLLRFPIADAVLVSFVNRAINMMIVFPTGLVANYLIGRKES